MDTLSSLVFGLSVALDPINLLYCFMGVFFGTLVGVLPGLGPPAAMSLLFAMTFRSPPVAAIIMLAGIYYGAMYGGSTTSILVNIPGETASIVTCFDGYQMARRGRAGPALGISAFGSFIGGTLSVIGLMFFAPILMKFALDFGPPEYFSLMVFGLTIVSFLSKGSLLKALMMACFGLFLGTVGFDVVTGNLRFTLGTFYLMDGVNLIPVCMGLFGLSEVFVNIEQVIEKREIFTGGIIKGILPNVRDWKDSIGAILRGSILGFFLGLLPGGGSVLSSFFSYGLEKRISKHPEKFGTGVIEGVAGPETANNAATGSAFIPLLSLGIPANIVSAILLGALLIHGVHPGPLLMQKNPEIFWGIIASMYVGNAMLLILNLPLIGMWVKILKIPYRILFPLILLFCLIGAYTVNYNIYDLIAMIFFGVLGYLFRKLSFDVAPLVLALVLGPIFEYSFCQSMKIGGGNILIFLERPISTTLLLVAVILLLLPLIPFFRKKKVVIEEAMKEE
jgi:putative tricarboxylic transport membrane protein